MAARSPARAVACGVAGGAAGTKLPPIPPEEAEYFDSDVVERLAEAMRSRTVCFFGRRNEPSRKRAPGSVRSVPLRCSLDRNHRHRKGRVPAVDGR